GAHFFIHTRRHSPYSIQLHLRQQYPQRHPAQNRQMQCRSRRSPHCLRPKRTRSPALSRGRSHHSCSAKRRRRPLNRSHISRVLHSRQHHQQRRAHSLRHRQQIRQLHLPRLHQHRHSLRMLRIRNPLKQPVRSPQHRESHVRRSHQRRQSFPMPLSTLAKKNRLHAAPRRQRLLRQPHSLHSHRSTRRSHSSPQRHTELFQPPVVSASQYFRARPHSSRRTSRCTPNSKPAVAPSASHLHPLTHPASLPNFPLCGTAIPARPEPRRTMLLGFTLLLFCSPLPERTPSLPPFPAYATFPSTAQPHPLQNREGTTSCPLKF